MFIGNALRNILVIICLVLAVFDLIDLTNIAISQGPAFFTFYQNIFSLIFVVCTLLIAVFILTGRGKAFIITFGVYVTAEFAFGLVSLLDYLSIAPIDELFSMLDTKTFIYFVIRYIVQTVALGAYAIVFDSAIVFAFKQSSRKYKLIHYAFIIGCVIAVINVAIELVAFTTMTDGFSFLDCFLDLISAFIFSLIYIFVPRYLS